MWKLLNLIDLRLNVYLYGDDRPLNRAVVLLGTTGNVGQSTDVEGITNLARAFEAKGTQLVVLDIDYFADGRNTYSLAAFRIFEILTYFIEKQHLHPGFRLIGGSSGANVNVRMLMDNLPLNQLTTNLTFFAGPAYSIKSIDNQELSALIQERLDGDLTKSDWVIEGVRDSMIDYDINCIINKSDSLLNSIMDMKQLNNIFIDRYGRFSQNSQRVFVNGTHGELGRDAIEAIVER